MIKPIVSLTETAHRIEEGDYRERAPVEFHDEIGTLNQTFNSMVQRTQEALDNLKVEINERELVEKKLRESQAKLQAIIDPCGGWDYYL